MRERLDHEPDPLEGRQPGRHKEVIAVAVAAIGTRRWGWIQHLGLNAAPLLEPTLNRPGLREDAPDVARQQIPIRSVNHPPAQTLLDTRAPRQRPAEPRPLVVVFAHPVVEPADVRGMPRGVARKSEADDVVNRVPVVCQTDIGQPGRQIRRTLPAEPVLGGPDHGGVVPRLA